MGYRSEVRCLIYGPKDKLNLFLTTQALFENTTVFRDFKDSLERYTIETKDYIDGKPVDVTYHVLDLYGDSWKWYPGYPDVDAWHQFIEAAEYEGELEVEFIRIGEEDGDIERINSPDNSGLLYVSTPTIRNDFDKGEIIPLLF